MFPGHSSGINSQLTRRLDSGRPATDNDYMRAAIFVFFGSAGTAQKYFMQMSFQVEYTFDTTYGI